jgi:hypothetical protein
MLVAMTSGVVGQPRDVRDELLRVLKARFHAAVLAVQPEAHLKPRKPSADNSQEWSYPNGTVTAWFRMFDTVELAMEHHEKVRKSFPIPTELVKDFSDGAYVAAAMTLRHMSFRRGLIVVNVTVEGEQNVRPLAALFLDEVNRVFREGVIYMR